ncbi:hypothetical protein BE221DRAFT_212134 [Ostreococcus tauri]|uniref:Uncharacterized protein n=1 Tax=Ostreococcus tauri TaxID=70448 RepID=A0A1Y5IB99_OSTTA|nr:hypothetical protein BE221DRAFT_212134 [Ostreococcus tauri]
MTIRSRVAKCGLGRERRGRSNARSIILYNVCRVVRPRSNEPEHKSVSAFYGRIPPTYATTTIANTPKMTFAKMFDSIGLSGNPPSPTLSFINFFRISGDIPPGLRSVGVFGFGASRASVSFGSTASRALIELAAPPVCAPEPFADRQASIHRCAFAAFSSADDEDAS